MAKVDYPASAAQIVELVGGPANISKVTHCVTCVRFILKDQSIASANADAVKAVPGVLQVVEAGGQYQVVIGTTVEQMYDEVVKLTGNAGGEVAADAGQDDTSADKGNIFNRFIKMMAGVMMPILQPLTGCGIIASLSTLLLVLGVAPDGSDTYTFLYGIGQTCLFFFPVLIGATAAKYFHMDSFLGAVIGGALMYPVLNNAELAGAIAHVFGILPVTYRAYSSTVFPALAAVAFAAPINRWLKKVIPDMMSFFLVPTLTLIIVMPVAFAVIAPVMNVVSDLLMTAMGASGLFGLPMYMNPDGSMGSFIGAVLTNVAAFVACFLVTYFWPGFDPDKE